MKPLFLKVIFSICLAALPACADKQTGSAAPAKVAGGGGGVSDGGGNLADQSVSVGRIREVLEYSGPTIKSWLHRREYKFSVLSEEEKRKSPDRKIFGSGKKIYDVWKETGVELRLSKACFDAKGVDKFGSIYASQANTVCLSPFLIASQVNRKTVVAETYALLIHELSHLLGTTEDEAKAIQLDAYDDFLSLDPVRVQKEVQELQSALAGEVPKIDAYMHHPEPITDDSRIGFETEIETLYLRLLLPPESSRLLFVPAQKLEHLLEIANHSEAPEVLRIDTTQLVEDLGHLNDGIARIDVDAD